MGLLLWKQFAEKNEILDLKEGNGIDEDEEIRFDEIIAENIFRGLDNSPAEIQER